MVCLLLFQEKAAKYFCFIFVTMTLVIETWMNMCSACVIFEFSSVNLHPSVGVVVSNPEGPLIFSLSTVGRITLIYL